MSEIGGHSVGYAFRSGRVVLCGLALLAACDAGVEPPASTGEGGSAAAAAGSPGGSGGRADAGAGGSAGAAAAAGRGGAGSAGRAGAAGEALARGGTGGGAAGAGGSESPEPSADAVWSPLTVMALEDPMDHGAVGDGAADDIDALASAIDALPAAGGIVYLPAGKSFKKSELLVVTRSHVKFWAADRAAEIFQSVAGQRRHQSILCRDNEGCGFFGLKLRSDATQRFDALEDNQISADHASLVEVTGCEIAGSAATGIMLFGSRDDYIDGNYIHHTWADHIHHTDGARESWVWNNFVFNEEPSRGDDGVACVTYGPGSPRCADMEWWANTVLHTGWGRGYSVIGGDDISIHHNWAIGVAGAGIIVASESGVYDSASSDGIAIANNSVYQCGHSVGHPGILISGLNPAAEPLAHIALRDNVSADTVMAEAYRAEGEYTEVTNVGLATTQAALPQPIPGMADIRMADTTVLRTRDVSHVAANVRPGLHRIHVRKAPAGDGFEQRFEYVVKGQEDAVTEWTASRVAAGDHLAEQRTVSGTAFALLLVRAPLELPAEVSGVSFRELRAGDQGGELDWLWQRLNSGDY